MAKPEWIRVKSKKGPAHRYSVAESAFDPEMHEKVTGDAEDEFGIPIPTKYHVTKGGEAAESNTESEEAPK
jgi:hypothetical protein